MKMMKKLVLASAVSFGVLGAGSGMAATDGDLAATSTGNFDIVYAQEALVRIWGFTDVELTSGLPSNTQNLCIYSNGGSTDYQLTIDSQNGQSDSDNYFELTTINSTDKVPYALTFKSTATDGGTLSADNSQTAAVLQSNIDAGGLLDQPLPNQDCSLSNANATLLVDAGTLPAVNDGAYSDTVYLTVSPQ